MDAERSAHKPLSMTIPTTAPIASMTERTRYRLRSITTRSVPKVAPSSVRIRADVRFLVSWPVGGTVAVAPRFCQMIASVGAPTAVRPMTSDVYMLGSCSRGGMRRLQSNVLWCPTQVIVDVAIRRSKLTVCNRYIAIRSAQLARYRMIR